MGRRNNDAGPGVEVRPFALPSENSLDGELQVAYRG
jgi:hypothetical protein